MELEKEIRLNINGLGLILYSEFAVSHISEGEDYFSSQFQVPEKVQEHAYNGTIVGVCTGSPGTYIFKVRQGYPKDIDSFEFRLRVGLSVNGRVFIRDLYDLMRWTRNCPDGQEIKLDNGFYHVTLCSDLPETGILGDNQVIYAYFHRLDEMPKLKYNGVPTLCW